MAGLVVMAAYAGTVVTANWASIHWPAVILGPLVIPAGTLWAGVTLTLRDLLHEALGTPGVVAGVAVGAVVSLLLASPQIAVASAVAFAVSETFDSALYAVRGEDRLQVREIRRRLTASRYPAPLDPDTGQPSVWTVTVIRAILRNPKYLGRQVWGRTHHGKQVSRSEWICSKIWVHPPVVTPAEFAAANPRLRFPHSTTSAVDAA